MSKTAKDRLRLWRKEPWTFVRQMFGAEPQVWQDKMLHALADHTYLCATACKGPGKTTFDAWAAWWFMLCFHRVNIAATSVTGDNLRDGLWKEMGKWYSMSEILRSQFEMTSKSIKHKDFPHNWWMQARPFAKSASAQDQKEALAGLHEDNMMFIIDEAGGVPRGVVATADAAMGTEGGTKKLIMTGNPTNPDSPLGDAALKHKDLWFVIHITGDPEDPDRSPRVSVDWAQRQIDMYGRDNPWVMVNVLGQFPPAALNSLIGSTECEEAARRRIDESTIQFSQKRLGVDVARFGDDRTVFYKRQGLIAYPPRIERNLRTNEIADIAYSIAAGWDCRSIFVDDTGGYGAGVIDDLIRSGLNPIPVNFSQKPLDARYANKRAEMWFNLVEWIKRGGSIPNDPDLVRELTETTYTFNRMDKMQLEAKDQIKQRLGYSPDQADALALTFALPEMSADKPSLFPGMQQKRNRTIHDWDPLDPDRE